MPDAVAFRTDCRSKAEGNPIRAAKCCFEPRGTRLPDARISKPHPRKGTETISDDTNFLSDQEISKPHPRKGTETRKFFHLRNLLNHFKTTSPQGDGNSDGLSLVVVHYISKPHPRKGTETVVHHDPLLFQYFKTTSPQGDGNRNPCLTGTE